MRITRDGGGRVTMVERGNVADQSDAAWAAMTVPEGVTIAYNGNGREISATLIGSDGAARAVTQYSYDGMGRPECTATRMNPAAFAALPASACLPGPEGNDGPDRIAVTVYGTAGDVFKTISAYGTDEQTTDTIAYRTANGQLATLTDAEGNTTTYEYDGHDRLVRTRYPVPAQGAGTSSATDYEELGYDADGNVISRRLRDGQVIAYSYDALNRLVLKDVPNLRFYESDVAYSYDLLGHLIQANAVTNGQSNTLAYDALGRTVSETGSWAGTKTMQYDLAGRRTRLTWNDGFFVTYDYLTTGEMTAIHEYGGLVLASFGYDDLGRRTSLTYGDGSVTSYGYDPVSRLSSLSHDLAGTADDLTLTFAYNPASQITNTTRDNDAYAWTGHGSGTTTSTANGLNQLVTLGGATLGYDARGNLTDDGAGHIYAYTATNRLTSAPGTNAGDDAFGRLYYVTSSQSAFDYVGQEMIVERDAIANTVRQRYVFGPGVDEPLVWYEGAGTTDRHYLHADERGSLVAVTDSAGSLLGRDTYDEYGKPGAGNIGRFQYTGQMWLPEIGVYYYKARMYDPSRGGRFMQPDPLGWLAGPNGYAYVGDDPINFIDPLGLDEVQGPPIIVIACHDPNKRWDERTRRCVDKGTSTAQVGHNDGKGDGGSVDLGGVAGIGTRPRKDRSERCLSDLHKLGELLGKVGEATTWAGLGASLLGGPEFLELAAGGGVVSTIGDIASAISGDRRAGLRLGVSSALFGVTSVFVPRSIKNTVVDAVISQLVGEGAESSINGAIKSDCR